MHEKTRQELEAILDDGMPWISVLATAVCTVHHAFSHFHWTGFYCVSSPGMLSVGPYQGGHGCVWIPFSRGICGTAARSRKTQWIRDVHTREDHIACSSTTNSEVVVPVLHQGEVIAVLDVDSDILDAFSAEDVVFLESVAELVARYYHPLL